MQKAPGVNNQVMSHVSRLARKKSFAEFPGSCGFALTCLETSLGVMLSPREMAAKQRKGGMGGTEDVVREK